MAEKNNTKSERFNIRLSPGEAEKLRSTSEKLGVSMADVIRNGIKREHKMSQNKD